MVFTPRGLMVTSVVVGAIAVATLALSVATDAWLFTTEIVETPEGNRTIKLTIQAQMGLWKVCLNTGRFHLLQLFFFIVFSSSILHIYVLCVVCIFLYII